MVAAGTIERPYVFQGNDLPGVMTSGAVQRLIRMYGVKPGTRAVVFTANESGDSAVAALQSAGISIARVVDARSGEGITSASGSKSRVKRVTLSDGTTVECDLLVTAVGWTTPTSLLNMAGDRPVYDADAARFFPAGPPDNVLATGGMVGGRDELIAHGRSTGKLAAGRPPSFATAFRLQRPERQRSWAEPDYPADERRPARASPASRAVPLHNPRHRRLLRGRLLEGPLQRRR